VSYHPDYIDGIAACLALPHTRPIVDMPWLATFQPRRRDQIVRAVILAAGALPASRAGLDAAVERVRRGSSLWIAPYGYTPSPDTRHVIRLGAAYVASRAHCQIAIISVHGPRPAKTVEQALVNIFRGRTYLVTHRIFDASLMSGALPGTRLIKPHVISDWEAGRRLVGRHSHRLP
jgi:hypothetical protein